MLSVAYVCAGLTACTGVLRTRGSAGPVQRYELTGKVVSVDKAGRKLVIAHEEVPGLMEAMTMPFTLKAEWAFDAVGEGDRVQATLVVADDSSWLENPVITKASGADSGTAGDADGATPAPGAEVMDFSLVNQDGKPIRLRGYRGQALLITFIYTRCPLPDYCTLMSTNFAGIERELQNDPALRDKTHLLSVSIDPAHDTPKVLRSYGAAHTERYDRENFKHWEFATGAPGEIQRMARFFGLTYYSEKDQIVHSLRTALVAPDGRLAKIYHGNEWKPSEVVGELRKLFGENGHPAEAHK